MKKAGVYLIINKISKKVYVGSSENIERRINQHKTILNKNKHNNDHLQYSWNKYGNENFVFINIEYCEEKNLLKREQFWMDFFKSYNKENGYNRTATANCAKLSNEAIEKIRQKALGNDHGKAHKGRILSAEHLKNLSEAHKGHIPWNKGRKVNLKCRNCGKIYSVVLANKDRSKYCSRKCHGEHLRNNPEWSKIISMGVRKSFAEGRIVSEETRKKLSNSIKKVRADRFWSSRRVA